ncbi:hypothetical protein SAMN04487968_11931 [Nocardioides terrae]|uniref:Uncharacterized protein n=1 Tax=Nocardioides terrae TaxID=574651 RepID=A0A1I1NQD8_9ACTN|nr:hypothetical protein [Nocardioides terrae]SFC99747.1 hypothetical protein SAMN04487968_11931 [Nocardioides terrae]
MTEDQPYAGAESARTGVPAVDAVLAEVDGAVDLPADDQVAVFERAHDRLRRALDGQADDRADDQADDQADEPS